MKSATELIRDKFPNHNGVFVLRNIEEFMIEFAEIHVRAALQKAAKEVAMSPESSIILNCYPESKLK